MFIQYRASSTASISLFLALKHPSVTIIPPSASPPPSVSPNPALQTPSLARYRPQYSSHAHFIQANYASPPPHVLRNLPSKPTDILGLDPAAYNHVRRRNLAKTTPSPVTSRFFSLRFFPELHYVSRFRKSTVAYAFTNISGYSLNDPKLAEKWKLYSGKWRKHLFFSLSQLSPMDTAVGRSRHRKLVKRALFRSLFNNVAGDVSKVAGVFFFRFNVIPANEKDLQQMEAHIESAVKTVVSSKGFLEKLRAATIAQNRKAANGQLLMKEVQTSNYVWPQKVPGYYPKLPFLRDEKRLL